MYVKENVKDFDHLKEEKLHKVFFTLHVALGVGGVSSHFIPTSIQLHIHDCNPVGK